MQQQWKLQSVPIQAIQAEIGRRSLLKFCQVLNPEFKFSWHHKLICEKLELLRERKIRRLIITLPPQHGKSTIASQLFPAWALGHQPALRIIATSYGADLAIRNSRATQDIMDSPKYKYMFPHVRLNRGNDSDLDETSRASRRQDFFETIGTTGFYKAVGIGGAITGFGATLGIIDDYYKNPQEAQSYSHRENVLNWYRTAFRTRMARHSMILVVSARWDANDLVGSLLEAEKSDPNADKWTVVNLPALATEPKDPDPRQPGEALWPDQFPQQELHQIRSTLGAYWFSSLYQQNPMPREGQLVKASWLKFYSELPAQFDEVIQSWDLTFTGTEKSDYTVGQVWGRKGANKYLIYMVRDKLDFNAQIASIEAVTTLYPHAVRKLIEHAANASAVLATLSQKLPGLIAVKPKTSKYSRLLACSPQFEAGNVFLPEPAQCAWVTPLIDELMGFGGMQHDDTVDALTMALNHFVGQSLGQFTESMVPQATPSALEESW